MTESPEDTPAAPLTVPCPTCGQPSLFARSNSYRPFCSERCKQIDLGAWAAEDFRVPSDIPRRMRPSATRSSSPEFKRNGRSAQYHQALAAIKK